MSPMKKITIEKGERETQGWGEYCRLKYSGHLRHLCSNVIARIIAEIDPKRVMGCLLGIFEGKVFQMEEVARAKSLACC